MNRTVLVIEDNEQNLYLMKFLLEQNGYEVDSASDGPSGVARAAAHPPRAILLDIQLPGMDGYAVARSLRSNPDLLKVPIIVVTSYAMPGDRDKALESGATDYIEKPIDPDTFVAKLKPYLEERR